MRYSAKQSLVVVGAYGIHGIGSIQFGGGDGGTVFGRKDARDVMLVDEL